MLKCFTIASKYLLYISVKNIKSLYNQEIKCTVVFEDKNINLFFMTTTVKFQKGIKVLVVNFKTMLILVAPQ